MILEKIQRFCASAVASAGTLAKVAILSRRPAPKGGREGEELVIMGNGPSLRRDLDARREWLMSRPRMAVNFFANTPDYDAVRPEYYILVDGHFFNGVSADRNVADLWSRLADTDWDMTLFVARKYLDMARTMTAGNRKITVKGINLTPVEGWEWLCRMLIDRGLGMPRPRNVMVPAIMSAVREGFRRIYLCGADHTWTRTLSVDDENFVVSVQPHFYKDNSEEHTRVRAAYAGLRLHDVLGSMTVAFRSYWRIAGYARARGIEIINATPGSMIDAFPREAPVFD